MATRPRKPGLRALDRRALLVALATGVGAAGPARSGSLAREIAGGSAHEPLVSASASDVLVELLDLDATGDVQIITLRFTNAGSAPVGVGPGMIRMRPAAVPAGDPSDICALAPGHATHVALTLARRAETPLEAIEIGILEADRTGATVSLGFTPMRADARGGDALPSVRTDSGSGARRSPESLPACPH